MSLFPKMQVEGVAEWLAQIATECLIDEARLSPKPGLVDSRGSGAHHDLSLVLMERSAHSLTPMFQALAQQSWRRPADIALRQIIGRLGREGEQQMMVVTRGVNTHRGAIWALGLLVSAVAMLGGNGRAQQIVTIAAELAKLPDEAATKIFSKGSCVTNRYRVPGAREEAQQGFPHIMQRALPQLRLSRLNSGETHARLDALMAIMTSLTDTCVLSRAGMEGLNIMQRGARAVLRAGGTAHPAGQAALAMLDSHMLALNASPGGAADLLAATLFLDRVESLYLKH
ncbi:MULTISPECIES: triphosphoribosyl-dephospho-CoA synthase [Serratia]|uniref:triphosphoribosyl-dephospho-CoA synthase n=1 Tax=Serratia TaxID=613 RepID=UPI0009B55264|nr:MULTISPECIES: triphosphoribosyl-dephospho-CoA synthase [Serratia]MDR8490331.1 triphosphoribosyl-dephospho-CoA synthase [Serratia nevei]HAU5647460.1 triphosphoribosyl-dephospho-CoA synthase [Serratia marcescens]HBB6712930.1 triphosphoribosyl-dephospho-CoA synthase [Serratia marcescens]